jgi:hypothetical protein
MIVDMIYSYILALHISIAISTIGVVGYSLYAIARAYARLYRALFIAIGAIVLFEVSTGILIAILSPSVTLLSIVPHMLAYLAVCFAVQGWLVSKMRNVAHTSTSF